MNPTQFLSKEYDFLTFVVLSAKALATLSADLQAKYKEYLAKFITDFKAKYPDGTTISLDLVKLGTLFAGKNRKGQPVNQAAIVCDTDDQPNFVPEVIVQSQGQLDILARSAGFPAWQVLAIVAASALRKGKLNFRMVVRVEGEVVKDRSGKDRTITKTHIAQEDFELALSDQLKAMQANTAAKASEKAFLDMMYTSPIGNGGTNQEVVAPDADEDVNP